ncbi:MAG: heme biosynthesis HemY N-terminal domain-containing protein [Alphaproteobacteria bacterium]
MIRALLVLLVLAAVGSGAAWLADHPGEVTILLPGYRVDTSFAVLVGAAALLAFVAGLAVRLWAYMLGALRISRQARAERRRRRGYRALTQGLVAVAAGDAAEARRQARRAETLLGEPPLTKLLSAQAAQLEGDAEAARTYFAAMLERPDTAFLGLRGLLTQALRDGEMETAMTLAERAYKLRPATPWVARTLAELQAHAGSWQEAARTMHRAARSKAIATEEGRRKEAAALFGQSLEADGHGRPAQALALMRRAHKLAPAMAPTTARLARLLAASGQERRAEKLLEKAWAQAPHPDLARAYGDLRPAEEPLARVRRVERLAERNPEHGESHIALAEAALAADLWGEARRHLEAALEARRDGAPSRRAYRLMAEVEESEHGDAVAAGEWLARATEVEPDDAWVCERCAAAASAWVPACPQCDSFDSLVWGSPLKAGFGAIAVSAAPARELRPAPAAGERAAGGVDAA